MVPKTQASCPDTIPLDRWPFLVRCLVRSHSARESWLCWCESWLGWLAGGAIKIHTVAKKKHIFRIRKQRIIEECLTITLSSSTYYIFSTTALTRSPTSLRSLPAFRFPSCSRSFFFLFGWATRASSSCWRGGNEERGCPSGCPSATKCPT